MNQPILSEHKPLKPASKEDMVIYKRIAQNYNETDFAEVIEAAIYCTNSHKELADQLRIIIKRLSTQQAIAEAERSALLLK